MFFFKSQGIESIESMKGPIPSIYPLSIEKNEDALHEKSMNENGFRELKMNRHADVKKTHEECKRRTKFWLVVLMTSENRAVSIEYRGGGDSCTH